ncbi:MAG: glycogen/starch synthase [Paludibacteraceae bacterium]|nr:glycogen/starch synthase [Paludibacteraceae bacterium]
MKEIRRILFISQEITPYLSETPRSLLGRMLPQTAQESGFETRTFMPKFGEINERRNQLHEVIRLSGMNLIIDDTDHPLIIKVASIPSARIQVYFIDNEDYFHRRRSDEPVKSQSDNDERSIFFVRGVLETVKKLRWTPDIIYCQGWMSALAPLYIKRAYQDDPFFRNSKIVYSLTDIAMPAELDEHFAEKSLVDGVEPDDLKQVAGGPVSLNALMRLAIDYSDAVMLTSESVNEELLQYAQQRNLPVMPYTPLEQKQAYVDFFHSLITAD